MSDIDIVEALRRWGDGLPQGILLMRRGAEEIERLRAALERLSDAADDVGVQFFDTDTMAPEVEEMQAATEAARALIKRAKE